MSARFTICEVSVGPNLDTVVLLLFRIHALWGGRRDIVIGTFVLWFLSYICIGVAGLLAAIEIIGTSGSTKLRIFFSIHQLDYLGPLRYDHLTRQCFSDHKPKVLPAQWAVSVRVFFWRVLSMEI